jgi:hypothetical protein
MKFNNFSAGILCLLLIALFIFACSNSINPISDLVEADSEVQLRSSLSTCASPTFDNGTMVFSDSAHFFCYYSDLADKLDDNDSVFIDAIIKPSESNNDFESVFYKVMHDSFEI